MGQCKMTSPLIYSILLLLSAWEISTHTPAKAYGDSDHYVHRYGDYEHYTDGYAESKHYTDSYKDSKHYTDGTGYKGEYTSSGNGGKGLVLTPFNPKLWNIFKHGSGDEGAIASEIEGFELSGLGIWQGVLGIYSAKEPEEYTTEKPYEQEYTTEKEYTTTAYTTKKPYTTEYTTEKHYTTEEVYTEKPRTPEG